MTDQEINARCAALAGVPEGQAFDAINNEDDLAKVIIKQSEGDVDLAALTERAQREAGDDYQAAFRRLAAEAYAALQG